MPWLSTAFARSGGRGPARGRPRRRGERAAGPGVQRRGGRARALRAAAVVRFLARLHAQRLVRAVAGLTPDLKSPVALCTVSVGSRCLTRACNSATDRFAWRRAGSGCLSCLLITCWGSQALHARSLACPAIAKGAAAAIQGCRNL